MPHQNRHFGISRLAEVAFLFTITCLGYKEVDEAISVTAGLANTVNVELANAMNKVA